jgi:hypothetical protein
MEIYGYHIYSTRKGGAFFHEDLQDWVQNADHATMFQSYDSAKRIASRLASEGVPGASHSVFAVVGG